MFVKILSINAAIAAILFGPILAVDLKALGKSGKEDDCGFMSETCCDLKFTCPAGSFSGKDFFTCRTCPPGSFSE
jgi:hypothetical protein